MRRILFAICRSRVIRCKEYPLSTNTRRIVKPDFRKEIRSSERQFPVSPFIRRYPYLRTECRVTLRGIEFL